MKHLLFAAAVVVAPALLVAACAIQLRRDEDSALPASSVLLLLKSCDPVASEHSGAMHVSELQECRRARTAENLRRFIGQRKATAAPADAQPGSLRPSSAQPMDRERAATLEGK
jgi:hypothetical protein